MITIHYDFTDGTELSYDEGMKKGDDFTTNCLTFFEWNDEVDDIRVVKYNGSILTRNELLGKNSYTTKEIRKEHNIYKLLVANLFNW